MPFYGMVRYRRGLGTLPTSPGNTNYASMVNMTK